METETLSDTSGTAGEAVNLRPLSKAVEADAAYVSLRPMTPGNHNWEVMAARQSTEGRMHYRWVSPRMMEAQDTSWAGEPNYWAGPWTPVPYVPTHEGIRAMYVQVDQYDWDRPDTPSFLFTVHQETVPCPLCEGTTTLTVHHGTVCPSCFFGGAVLFCKYDWASQTECRMIGDNPDHDLWDEERHGPFADLFGSEPETIRYVEGGTRCEDHTYVCESCGHEYAVAENAETCCWPFCENCGDRYEDSEDAWSCCNEENYEGIHSYSSKIPTLFHEADQMGEVTWAYRARPGVLYMGVELEMEKAAPHVLDFLNLAGEVYNRERFIMAKSDGSLGDGGVEMVTAPATLDAFRAAFPFDAIDWLREQGARSYQRRSCGFHVHVSRSAFMEPSHLWRFVAFQVRNQQQVCNIAQRGSTTWATWPNTLRDIGDMPELVKGKAKNEARYVAINFQNDHTVELRYMKGNLLREAIMRKVEMVDAVFTYTQQVSVRDIRSGAFMWDRFAAFVEANRHRYPELASYIGADNNNEEE